MSPGRYTEAALVEKPALELLGELGWTGVDAYAEALGPVGTLGRDSTHEVVLTYRLRDALGVLNHGVPDDVLDEALAALVNDRSAMDPVRANREVYDLVRDGYRAEWRDAAGDARFATVRYLDFNDSTKNDWLAASQVRVAGELHNRRADVVLFVNGIPLVLAEFKEPGRPVEGGVRRKPVRLPRHNPPAVPAQRVRHPLQRLGGQGRRHLRTVGLLRRLEGDRRRRHPWRGGAGDGHPGHVCA